MPESKSGALPLGDIPMPVRRLVDTPGIIAWMFRFCNPFFRFFREFSGQKFRHSSRPVIANQSADRCVKSSGRGRFPPITGHSEEHWCENPPDERYSRTTSLAPRIYEGGGPRSGRGSPPPQRREPSQSRFACQLSRRESQGRFAPILREHRTQFERFAVTLSFSLGQLVPLLFVIL